MPDVSAKMIAFDLFGVLLEEGHLITNGLLKYLPADIEKQKVKNLYEDYNLDRLGEKKFWHALGIPDYRSIRQAFLDDFKLDPDFESVITELGDYSRLAILSNLPADWADELSEKFDFKSKFEPICFSGHLGLKKPQAEIYLHLINQSGLSAEDIIFIDDRLENLQSAKSLGLKVIYYQRENELNDFTPDFTIHRLSDLLAMDRLFI